MPYTAHTWINGDSANTTKLNNLEQQYTEATLSFGPDVFTAGFVLSGYTPSGTVGTTTVNVAGGTAYLLQADGTTRQRKQNATTQTTSALSSTYNLYLQPDGTWYWSTSNSPAANSLYVAQVTTNGSGQIATVTDKRSLTPNLFPGSAASPTFPTGIAATAPSSFDTALIRTDGLGALSLSPPAAPAAPILATAVSSGDTYRTTTLADTPTRYYRLDESAGTTAADSSGNAQTGTYVGGPTLLVTGALTGDTDTAITLNGTSQYVTVPAAGLATGANAWSLECWLKFASNPASNKILMSFGDQGVANGAPQLILDTTGHVTVNSNGTGTGAGAALTTGVWHHLVGTYDGTTLRMYVDGALSGTTATVTCAVPNPPPFATIGGSAAGSPGFLTAGSLDEAGFYNTALSATAVLRSYTIATKGPGAYAQNLSIGTYKYAITYASATSETAQGSQGTITTTSGNQKVSLTNIPTGPTGTTKRNIYRTTAGGSGFSLLTTLADNTTTTYTDTTVDTALGAAIAVHSSAGGGVWKNSAGTVVAQVYGDGYANFAGFPRGLPSVGGQATVGSFGVPVIVAQAIDSTISVNTQQTIVSFTTPNDGKNHLFRLHAALFVGAGNTNNGTVTLGFNYTDPHSGSDVSSFRDSANNDLTSFTQSKGFWILGVLAPEIEAKPNTAVNITYQNSAAGTISDTVSGLIEMLY